MSEEAGILSTLTCAVLVKVQLFQAFTKNPGYVSPIGREPSAIMCVPVTLL